MNRLVLVTYAIVVTSCTASPQNAPVDASTEEGGISEYESLECDNASVPINDPGHCGDCNHNCLALPHTSGEVKCVEGACVLTETSCTPGWANCSDDPEDGCDTDITRPDNCGVCFNNCSGTRMPYCAPTEKSDKYQTVYRCVAQCPEYAPEDCDLSCADTTISTNHCAGCCFSCPDTSSEAPLCVDGECWVVCKTGFHVCGEQCVSNTSIKTCGDSCEPCKGPANSVLTCDGVQCGFDCKKGYLWCNEECIREDEKNCGACGEECDKLANVEVGVTCTLGICANPTTLSCKPGYAHCTTNIADGCKTKLSDPNNCGQCGKKCPSTSPLCALKADSTKENPARECSSGCGPDETLCDDCVNTNNDPLNCGKCGKVCPSIDNGDVVCEDGKCKIPSCDSGYHLCFDKCVPSRSPLTCGENCTPCAEDQICNDKGECVCDAASCKSGCCDKDEICQQPSIEACGIGGTPCKACKLTNATAECAGGVCQIAACYGKNADNCDKKDSNGCETDLMSSTEHCGECGNKCPARANATAPTCSSGDCKDNCVTPYDDCDGNTNNGCEAELYSDQKNCGKCGQECERGDNVAAVGCSSGKCVIKSCNSGFKNCNGNPDDGCETDLKDISSCGDCNVDCNFAVYAPETAICDNGTCQRVCKAGYCGTGFAVKCCGQGPPQTCDESGNCVPP